MWQKKIFFSAAILVVALMGAFPAVGLPAGESSTDTLDLATTESSVLEAYGKLPLLFIENQGQVDEAVRYYVKASGQAVYFTEENIVFDLIRSDGAAADDTADRLVFCLDFLGVDSQPVIEGSGKDSAVVNYFIGNDPENWYADVPTYRELVYRDIYPNIDLRLYGNGGMLRYDFVVNLGATPESIALAYNGIDSLAIIDGELVMGTAFGDIVQSQPYIYQQIGDEVVEVEGGFRLGSDNTYGFHVAAYNSHYPLIIDPVLLDYSTYLGGEGNDLGTGIDVDSEGYAYVTGYTYSASPGFPTTPGAFQTANAGGVDAFVTKLAPVKNALVYSTYLGNGGSDYGSGIAVDSDGHAYVTGTTYSASPGFPTTPGAFQTANAGLDDAFVTKLAPAGNALVYSTYLGGDDSDSGHDIAVDSEGYAYVTGTTWSDSPGFPIIPGAFQTYNAGGCDAFVTMLALDGKSLWYSTFLGGEGTDYGNGIALDSEGHAYVTGGTDSDSPGFPTTPGVFQTANAGDDDAFVTKLATAGNALVYSTYLGGGDDDWGNGIAVDSEGHAYVTGETKSDSPGFPIIPGAFQTYNAGGSDAFVTMLALDGKSLWYSTYLGGEDYDAGYYIAVDSEGHAYVTGGTYSDYPGFPITTDAFQTANAGACDAFVTKLTGNALWYSTYLGGEDDDRGWGIAVDSEGYAYVTGPTNSDSPGFPTTSNAFQTANAGGSDAFVTKIGAPCDLTVTSTAGGTLYQPGVGTHTYDKGTVVDLVANPNTGYQFVNWTGDVGTIANVEGAATTITMNDDYSITANFAAVCDLSITSTAGGSVTYPGEGTFNYTKGTVVNLVANSDEGYRFDQWTGDIGTILEGNVDDATTTITMNDNYSITANFEAIYDLIICRTAGGTVTTPGVGAYTYDKGTVINLVATPDAGYRFVNWTGNVGTIADDEDAVTTITMDDDYFIIANFEEEPSTPSGPGGCFIATAAYGTPMAEEIQILREFRDEYLLTNPVGQALVGLYYRVSPPIAGFITEHPSLKPIVRAGLVPAVAMSTVAVNTTPAEKAAIASLLALVSVALAVWATRRRGRSPQYTSLD